MEKTTTKIIQNQNNRFKTLILKSIKDLPNFPKNTLQNELNAIQKDFDFNNPIVNLTLGENNQLKNLLK
jgi:hypothetical protein